MLADTPLFEKAAGNNAQERAASAILIEDPKTKKKGKWKGQVSTGSGILAVKPAGKDRYINVAFSPYTVCLRYYKDNADKTAGLRLLPFWPLWEEKKNAQSPGGANVVDAPNKVTIKWPNGAKADRGSLAVLDSNDQVVYAAAIPAGKLAAGAQQMDWDKKYRDDAWNSRMRKRFLAADGPYKYKVITAVSELKADSLKIEWLVKNTDRLERGLLVILDGSDKVVFRLALPKFKLTKSINDTDTRSYSWNGKYSDGIKNSKKGDSIIPEDMPYRVQIQAHTGIDQANALALAVMHTEVRLAVHPRTRDASDPVYSRQADSSSLSLRLGPVYAGPLPADDTKALWSQIKLAEAGYHPGPVLGKNHAQYALALREFQRSVPTASIAPDKNWDRLAVNGTADADTRDALLGVADAYRRPKFGDPFVATLDAHPDKTDAQRRAISDILGDRTKGLIVWVDARHYYTQSRTPANQPLVAIDNYHGAFTIGDGLEPLDAASTCRPWIPLLATPRLLGKGKKLSDPLDPPPADAATRQAMRNAIGPLRVDWTFDEIGPDFSHINTGAYNKNRVRTLRFVQWALRTLGTLYERKDLKRKVLYTNCPKNNGGIRDAAADYYKAAFGYGDDESLWPWHGLPDSTAAHEGIATVIHDRLVSTQPADAEPLYEEWRGRAGVYFCPSIVAGDGFRARAQVRFAQTGTYQFPNLDVLAKRYPHLPQACTARMRVWRRTSVRGYLRWAPGPNNLNHINGMNAHYHGAHVHFVPEAGANFPTYRPRDLIDTPARETAFRNILAPRCARPYHQTNPGLMRFHNNNCYPWYAENDMGWPFPSAVGAANARALIADAEADTWNPIREPLLLSVITRVEERDGRLRGHLLAQFRDTPPFFVQQYACDGCGDTFWYLERRAGGGTQNGTVCPSGCVPPGRLRPGVINPAPRSIISGGIGLAAGGTWLPSSFTPWEWAHEVGHHRHLEHAATAPVGLRTADRDRLHDSQVNSLAAASFDGAAVALNLRWDRCCVMSYVDLTADYNLDAAGNMDANLDRTCFCGKCLLRNAGWKVEAIADPAANTGPGGNQNDD